MMTKVRVAWAVSLLCGLGLCLLTLVVNSGLAFRWWDYQWARIAEQSTDSYSHPTIIAIFRVLNVPGDVTVVGIVIVASMALVVIRRSRWLVLLSVVLLLTVPIEYATKSLVHSPPPVPDVVMQPTLGAAQLAQMHQPQSMCPFSSLVNGQDSGPAPCHSGSFLSGAAARIMILAGFVAWNVQRRMRSGLGRLAIVALSGLYTLVAGVGRVYLRWHWPSDVLGAYLLAGLFLCLLWIMYHRNTDGMRRAMRQNARHFVSQSLP